MSDVINEDIKKKELEISNSSINVYISGLSVLLNLFILNSINQKLILSPVLSMLNLVKYNPQSSLYQIKLEEDQYLASPFL